MSKPSLTGSLPTLGSDTSLPAAKQETARRKQHHAFEQELWQMCAPFAHTSSPLLTLCERVERFLPELFVFVAIPGVPAENKLAERSVHPLVIARKISGERGVQWAVRPAWVSSASLAPGQLRGSIRSCNALPSSPKTRLYHTCEQYWWTIPLAHCSHHRTFSLPSKALASHLIGRRRNLAVL
jgi:hypothetical protein